MTRIAELVERVRAATESDTAELFGDACRVLLPHNWWIDGNRLHHFLREGAYTDAALALCERVRPGWRAELRFGKWPAYVKRHDVTLWDNDTGSRESIFGVSANAPTLPLAILLALLLSLESAP